MSEIQFTYINHQAPRKYTFEMPQVKRYVESQCVGSVLNLFAGKVRLNLNEIRVDINSEFEPHFIMDAHDFITTYEGVPFSTAILDPPYNVRKAKEKYGVENYTLKFTRMLDDLAHIVNDRIIILGYKSNYMGKKRGFYRSAICLVSHGGHHNDTIIVTEKKNRLWGFE